MREAVQGMMGTEVYSDTPSSRRDAADSQPWKKAQPEERAASLRGGTLESTGMELQRQLSEQRGE